MGYSGGPACNYDVMSFNPPKCHPPSRHNLHHSSVWIKIIFELSVCMDISCMHECTVCVGGTVCVGPSVEGLFWAVTARQCVHTDPRQHYGSQHQSHNNFVCVCVQIASLLQSLFCLAYIMMLWWIMYDRNLLRFHLNMRHQLQHDCGFLHVSCVSYYYHHCVLVHHKNT